MSDNAVAYSAGAAGAAQVPTSLGRPRAFNAIVYAGLTVGVLDALDAVTFFGLRGISPIRIFQHIASGLLGRASFNGGIKTVLLGLVLHFLIGFIIATVYYGASLVLPTLIRHPFVWGPIYGVVAYFVMNRVVIPLSAAPHGPVSLPVFLNGLLIHALGVGLPVVLFARRSAKAQSVPGATTTGS
jgi:hypothetical protein